MIKKTDWTVKKSSSIYGVDFWGKPYFSLNKEGHVQVMPKGEEGPSLDIFKLVKDLKQGNVQLPLLLRFPDIIHAQIDRICSCFDKACKEQGYKGRYRGVFPIKVNQQSHIIQDIVDIGRDYNFGLEAGSKPELLIALALVKPQEGLIICNGFKDLSYVELALMSQKAGKNLILVIERKKELQMILDLSKKLNMKPRIGFRLKLRTQSESLWSESSGVRSKFGLSSLDLMDAVKILSEQKYLDCVELVHFHIGSQINSIQPIKQAIKETARFVADLHDLGCKIKYVDVGGGLGVDYDGSGDTKSSINYDVQEYANDVIFGLQTLFDEKNLPHPDIITESGRFIVAQSSLLVFDVLDSDSIVQDKTVTVDSQTSSFIQGLYDIYKNLQSASVYESYNDLIEKRKEINELFLYGVLSLKEASLAEKISWNIAIEIKNLTEGKPDYDDIYDNLKTLLKDVYFCNFSIFQSLPDAWALSYNFPVVPIHRLDEEPKKRAYLADLTCDSDGRLSRFIDYSSWEEKSYLPVHEIKKDEEYLMGLFLTGAYQEILGDLHNLFGDTDAVHIRINEDNKYSIEHLVKGDSILEVLKYVEFNRKDLLHKIHETTELSVNQGHLSRQEAGQLIKKFEESLSQHTYLK